MKNLELIQVIKATTIKSAAGDGTTHAYQYEHHDFNGNRHVSHINCGNIDKVFAKLRRKNGKSYAVRKAGSQWVAVDEATYLQARLEYLSS